MQENTKPTPVEPTTEELLRIEILARTRAARVAEVNGREIWDFHDLALIGNIAMSTFEQFIRKWPINGAFTIGRRRYVTADTGRAWLAQIAAANSYDGPKALNRRAA